MQILDNVKKVPGGLMIVPMFITAIINTFAPALLHIGDPTTALFTSTGTMCIFGLTLFITGTQIRIQSIGMMLKRGGTLAITKLLIAYLSGVFIMNFFGLDGFAGISAVAFVTVMSSCNPGVYLALVDSFGDGIDKSAFGLFTVIAVPAVPILIIGAANGATINYMVVIATLTPYILGIILGNLDQKIAGLFKAGTPIVLPFLGFGFGSVVNLINAVKAGLSGLLLTVLFIVVNVLIMLFIDRIILKRPGYAGTALSCVAGISVAIPTMIGASMPELNIYVETATSQVAMAMIITTIITPYITKALVKKYCSAKDLCAIVE